MRAATANLVPESVDVLQPWADAGAFGPAEIHTAATIVGSAAQRGSLDLDERAVLGAALAVWAPLHGHACVDLRTVAADVAADVRRRRDGDDDDDASDDLTWPEPEAWRDALASCPLVTATDGPLVLEVYRLYTRRQWVDEQSVAARIRELSAAPELDVDPVAAAALDKSLTKGDLQHDAASAAMTHRLSVVVGGPGTGKTYTVGCLLAALRTARPDLRMGLAAPTGKAAARLTEVIAGAGLGDLRAVTVHRLLGPRADHRTRFKHHAEQPLPYDIVVIDETSMLPLPLMARLLEAVGPATQIVLVGDPDQLESVEVGAVLADIVRAAADPASPLHRRVNRLQRQRRTAAESPLGPLRDAVREQRATDVVSLLRAGDAAALITWIEVTDGTTDLDTAVAAAKAVIEPAVTAAVTAATLGDGATALTALDQARLLCGHRSGPYGVESWNRHVTDWLFGGAPPGRDFPGRALLATRNDARTGIVNGETGVMVATDRGARAVFRRAGVPEQFSPAEIDEPETAFAMTVHKTQGSEYDTVVLVHPPSESPLATRELLYTAITRAKRRLVVIASEASLRRAVTTASRRMTGLVDALNA